MGVIAPCEASAAFFQGPPPTLSTQLVDTQALP